MLDFSSHLCDKDYLRATAYPLPFYRGCLFITYEVVALDKAVTIDTRAILQEKYKSYIYLKATPSDEKENLAAGTECRSPRPKLSTQKNDFFLVYMY